MSKNIFQLWEENNKLVPFKVKRDNWGDSYYVVVEKIEITNFPYGKAYGYPVANSKKTNHYNYDKKWREEGLIPCAGCYQWDMKE